MKAIVLVPLALLALPVSAQQQTSDPAPLVESIDVSLINVDVTVTDDDGRPVTGLTEADFEVFEDGKPQQIRGFYAIEDAAVRFRDGSEQPASQNDDFRRRMILVFDNNATQKIPRNAAAEYVGRFLDNTPGDQSEWTVLSVGPTVKTVQPPTTDREAVRSALLRLRSEPTYDWVREIDRSIFDDGGRAHLRNTTEASPEADIRPSGYDFNRTVGFQSREHTIRNLRATEEFARAIIGAARAYTGVPGNKVMLVITGGMELNTSFGAFEASGDTELRELKRELDLTLDAMVKEANAANVKIYVVKAGGLQSVAPQHDVSNRSAGTGGSAKNPFEGDAYSKNADTSDVDSAPLTLALRTGGQYLPSNDTAESLARINDATSNFYSLAYAPTGGEDGDYHTISVRVKKKGMTVHHRRGYLALDDNARFERTLRSPLIFSREKGNLTVDVDLGLPEGERGKKRMVPITAALPISEITMLPKGEQYVGRVHVYLAIYDSEGNNIGYQHRVQDVAIPASEIEKAKTFPFRYTMKVGLEQGDYTVVMTLRDDISDQFGSGFQDVRL